MGDRGLYRIRNWLKNSNLTRKLLHSDGGKFDVKISEDTLDRLRNELTIDYQAFENLAQIEIATQKSQQSN